MTYALLDDIRNRLLVLTENMDRYSDSELRNIKNSVDVYSMKLRMELAARDTRMVDEACALPETPKTGG